MDSIRMAAFFCDRTENIVAHKRFVQGIKVSYEHDYTFGNEYIRVTFVATLNQEYYCLSPEHQSRIKEFFRLTPEYIFSLSKRSNEQTEKLWASYVRLIEFRYIYSSLTAYVINQIEKHFPSNTSIKIQSVTLDPEFNRAEMCLSALLDNYTSRDLYDLDNYTGPGWYYKSLISLSVDSKAIHLEAPQFKITDQEILMLGYIDLKTIHRIIIDYRVPIILKGYKFIEELYMHRDAFCSALYNKVQSLREAPGFDRKSDEYHAGNIEKLIKALSRRPKRERNEVLHNLTVSVEQKFPIAKGDILELKSGRLVIVEATKREISGHISVKYAILKRNLNIGTRSRIIDIRQISHILSSSTFKKYLDNNTVKNILLFRSWMQNYKHHLSET